MSAIRQLNGVLSKQLKLVDLRDKLFFFLDSGFALFARFILWP